MKESSKEVLYACLCSQGWSTRHRLHVNIIMCMVK